jgi:hypothetical protein
VVGDLIMLPVRVGVRATQLWLRAAEETISLAANATTRVVGLAASRSGGDNGGTSTMPRPETERRSEDEPAAASSAPAASEADAEDDVIAAAAAATAEIDPIATPEPPPPAEPTPVHVSEEPTLVEELAEPGAEEGAGAEIHIQEPWEGYTRMSAKEIVARLDGSTPAELAAVQLYESSQRQRQTILTAVQRELRRANGRGS